jgi:hypothetical protein
MMNLAPDFHGRALRETRGFNLPIADWIALRDELFRALKPFLHPHAQPPVDQSAAIAWIGDVGAIARDMPMQEKEALLEALETCYEKVVLEDYAEPWAVNQDNRRNSLIEQFEQTMREISVLIDAGGGMESGLDEAVPEEGVTNPLPRDRHKRSRRLVSLSREAFRREQFRIKRLSLHGGDSCSRLSDFMSVHYSSLETGISLASFHMMPLDMDTGVNLKEQEKEQEYKCSVSVVIEEKAFGLPETIDAGLICRLLKSDSTAELEQAFACLLRNRTSRTPDQLFSVLAGRDEDGTTGLFDALYQERPETVAVYLNGLQALAEARLITQDQLLSLIYVNDQLGYPVVHFELQRRSSPTAVAYLDALCSLVRAKLITPKQAQACAPIDGYHPSGRD